MIGAAFRDALDILNRNWLKIIGMVLLIYIVKLLMGTLPIQGTIILRFDPLAMVTSESLRTLIVRALTNGILFFILIQYITLTKQTMRGRLVTAITYPFRHPRLLYKGTIVLFLTNIILYFFWMLILYTGLGGTLIYAGGLSVRSGFVILVIVLLYVLLFWLFAGISQALYLLHDDPKLSTFRSIKESFSLMKGSRWSLLGLFVLTGLGLIIGMYLFIVGAIFTLVLYEVVRLAFYQELLRRKRQREWQDKLEEE
ncbi:hypothetical protein [Oceanobacillus bengalensis]|uniref:DUF975 family protein n=1 Tax=Oceanobacillus bengalensis TaxID=1435466 RepID=A0A494Z0B9_9BACI|nr:hypothetical protein [Oceanobacillus bengalensis]RKQ15886.1 hypothetical protein D8M05_09005 [Oceanobacillus bengalensis]